MKITAIAPWYGAKRKRALLDPIIKAIGRPDVLIEPFCGSCAVSLAVHRRTGRKPKLTIVNDLHRDLFNLALVLQSPEHAAMLMRRSSDMLFSEAMFEHCCKELADPIPKDAPMSVNRACAFLFVSWAGHNGFAGTLTDPRFNVRYTATGGDPSRRWRSVVESIPEWHGVMQGWTILNRDGFDVIDSVRDEAGTALYVDPPYHTESRSSARYVHDLSVIQADPLFGQGDIDQHALLQDRLSDFAHASVIVSHYDCPAIREIFKPDWWRFVENTQKKSVANASGSTKSEAPEVLILNPPALRIFREL